LFRNIRLENKNLKNLKLPPKNPKNQKSKKECSSEIMLKTINVQTHYVSKQNNQKISKTHKLPPKTPQNQKQN